MFNRKQFKDMLRSNTNTWYYEDRDAFIHNCINTKMSKAYNGFLFKFVTNSKRWAKFDLRYICALLELDRLEQAKEELGKYIRLHGLYCIHNYLPVAKLTAELGMTNELIQKSAMIFDIFNENNKIKQLQ
ncbi:MAG: hypothetical protein LBV04_02090 [Deferribacteraceae bacterium]|jgi:hypothetical protein|nr:hypothetical protein [Deferribacteraceae bacterium]